MNNENLLQKEAKMMKLEKLISERERIPDKPFPIPVKEILKRYEQLYTGAANGYSSRKNAEKENGSGINRIPNLCHPKGWNDVVVFGGRRFGERRYMCRGGRCTAFFL